MSAPMMLMEGFVGHITNHLEEKYSSDSTELGREPREFTASGSISAMNQEVTSLIVTEVSGKSDIEFSVSSESLIAGVSECGIYHLSPKTNLTNGSSGPSQEIVEC